MISVAIISIFFISGIVLTVKKIWPRFVICPICAGVFGTWIWILIGIWIGRLEADNWKLIAALLMGGSVVGIAYQFESKVRIGKTLAWKILFIPTGFMLAYNLIYFYWSYSILLSIIIAAILFFFIKWPVTSERHINNENRVEDIDPVQSSLAEVPEGTRAKGTSETLYGIENKMKNCC